MTDLMLRPGLDPATLAETFARDTRLQVEGFLRHDGAMALLRALAESREWRLAVNRGEEVQDYGEAELAQWPVEKREALDQAVIAGGRHGFRFRYETIRLPEYGTGAAQQPPPLLRA